jgi:hypothetical protein
MTQAGSVFVVVVVSVEVNVSLVDVAVVLVIVSDVCEVKVLVEVVTDVSVFEVVVVALVVVALVVAVLEGVVVAVLVIVVSTSISAAQLSLKAAYCTLPKELANDAVVRSMIERTRSKFGVGRYSLVLNLACSASLAAASCPFSPNIAEGTCCTPRSNAFTSRSASSVRS